MTNSQDILKKQQELEQQVHQLAQQHAKEIANGDAAKVAKEINNYNFIDPKEMVALHSVNLIVGRGIVFTAEKPDVKQWVDKLLQRNHFDYILKRIIFFLSYYGRALLTINKTADTGEYMLELVEPSFFSEVASVSWEPMGAVIWKKLHTDSAPFWVKEIWDTEKVVREIWDQKRAERVTIQSLNAKIPKEFQLTEKYTHNLGFVPIVEFLNKPWQDTLHVAIQKSYNLGRMADDYPVRDMPILINHTFRQLYKAYLYNMPRVVGAFSGKTIAELKRSNSEMAFMASDFFMFAGSGISSDGTTEGINIMRPAPNVFTELLDTLNRQLDIYFEGCGYSRDSGMKIDSATASLYTHSKDIQTTRSKIKYLHEKFNETFSKLLIGANKIDKDYDRSKPPFAFEIIENTQISELEETNLIILQKQNLMLSGVEAIARARGISKQDAEVLYEDIIKKQEKEQSLMMNANNFVDDKGQPNQQQPLKDQRIVAKEKQSKDATGG